MNWTPHRVQEICSSNGSFMEPPTGVGADSICTIETGLKRLTTYRPSEVLLEFSIKRRHLRETTHCLYRGEEAQETSLATRTGPGAV